MEKFFTYERMTEEMGEWVEMLHTKFDDFYACSSEAVTKEIKRKRKEVKLCDILLRKPEGKIKLGLSHILEDNIKMDFKRMGYEFVNWINQSQD